MAVATSTLIIGAIVAAGAGVSAYSANQAGKAQQSLSNYNASITEEAGAYNAAAAEQTAAYNASLSRLEARTAVVEGLAQAGAIRQQNTRIQATQRARMAASGVTVGSGSPLVVEVAQAGYLEMRALEAQRQASNRAGLLEHAATVEEARGKAAAGYEIWQSRSQASLDRMSGSAARSAGRLNATATLLQGAGSAAAVYKGIK
jgi:hypothetical protein